MVAAGPFPAVLMPVLLSLPLALIGCDGTSMAPRLGHGDDEPQFGKAQFTYCKPHVNVNSGTSSPRTGPAVIAVAPHQRVDVQLDDDSRAAGDFVGQLLVWEDGAACGQASLELDPDAELTLVFSVSEATTSRDVSGGRVVAFRGTTWLCPTGGQECRAEEMTGTVAEQPDDPVWQFHGPGVYTIPARTRFVMPDAPVRSSMSGSFPPQTVDARDRGRTGAIGFEADFVVGPDGTATGFMILDISDPSDPQVFEIDAGRFAVTPRGGMLVWLDGLGRAARTDEPVRFAATVSRLSIDDDPIWQFHAGGVYSARFEAAGQMTVLD